MTIIKAAAMQALFYGLVIAAWQGLFFLCVSVLKWWKPYAFPSPVGIWKSLTLMVEQQILWVAVWSSLKRAFVGYLLSIFIGLLCGLFLIRFTVLNKTVKPLILGVQTLPSICWVPFAILWFGLNESAIIFVIVMGSAFSIAISADMAIRNVNPLYVKAAKTMGARGLNLYRTVIFPASLPSLITGMKQGWSFAWRSLMAGEVMSASIGLGQALTMGRDLADINRVTLIIIIIIIIGALIERLVFAAIEERVLKRIGY